MTEMPLILDSREPVEIWMPILEKTGFSVTVETLPWADLIVNGRSYWSLKSYSDLIASRNSNHLHNEIYDMIINVQMEHPIRLGVWHDHNYGFARRDYIEVEEIIDHYNEYYLPVVKAKDRESMAHKIYSKELKAMAYDYPPIIRRYVEPCKGKISYVQALYSELPGIGQDLSMALLSAYPRPVDLVNAIVLTAEFEKGRWGTKKNWNENRWFSKIDGIGAGKAEKIERVLLQGEGV